MNWIRVEIGLPAFAETSKYDGEDVPFTNYRSAPVLVYTTGSVHHDKGVYMGRYMVWAQNGEADGEWADMLGYDLEDVTHWMPLPEPPILTDIERNKQFIFDYLKRRET